VKCPTHLLDSFDASHVGGVAYSRWRWTLEKREIGALAGKSTVLKTEEVV
jgi:hypothetical protein